MWIKKVSPRFEGGGGRSRMMVEASQIQGAAGVVDWYLSLCYLLIHYVIRPWIFIWIY